MSNKGRIASLHFVQTEWIHTNPYMAKYINILSCDRSDKCFPEKIKHTT